MPEREIVHPRSAHRFQYHAYQPAKSRSRRYLFYRSAAKQGREQPNPIGNPRGEPQLQKVMIRVGRTARYVRVIAKAFGAIPDGYLFKGSMSWLFTDEVLVE